MKVLYFTNKDVNDPDVIPAIIRAGGDEVITVDRKFDMSFIKVEGIEFVVSDRARYLITKDVIDHLPRRIVNLHPSFLPWNKGYFPNFWSFVSKTPSGITIHYIDEGIDTGNIIFQERFFWDERVETLRTTYDKCRREMVKLFAENWSSIRAFECPNVPQEKGAGNINMKADFDGVFDLLPGGWDAKIEDVKALEFPHKYI